MNDDTQTIVTYFVIAVMGTMVLMAGANFKKENPYSAMSNPEFGIAVSRDEYSTDMADEFCNRRRNDYFRFGESDEETLARCYRALRVAKRVF